MITEDVSVKIRGSAEGLRSISNKVRITITGREDLERMAKIFDAQALAFRKAGKHDRAIVNEAAARGCRSRRNFKITMPSDMWAKMKGGA